MSSITDPRIREVLMGGHKLESWIETYTGGRMDPLNPNPDEILMIDIGHALSMICRYNGHCKEFYSVAEHSIRLSRLVPEHMSALALMHDSAEAYMADLCRPIKYNVVGYREVEEHLLYVILEKYKVSARCMSPLKDYDNKLLITEATQLMRNTDGWEGFPEPYEDYIIDPWTPAQAEMRFLEAALELALTPTYTNLHVSI